MEPNTTLPKTPKVKEWVGLLSQTGTNAPTAIVLKNTLGGTITWARALQGEYEGTLTGAFTAGKTTVLCTYNQSEINSGFTLEGGQLSQDEDKIYIYNYLNDYNEVDGFTKATVVINVYQ